MVNQKKPLAVFAENIHFIILLSVIDALPFKALLTTEISNIYKLLVSLLPGLSIYMLMCLGVRFYFSLNGETQKNNFMKDGSKLIWPLMGFSLVLFVFIGIPHFIIGFIIGNIGGIGFTKVMLKSNTFVSMVYTTLLGTIFVTSTFFMIPLIIAGKFHRQSKYYATKNWFTENFIMLSDNFKRILPFVAVLSVYSLLSGILHIRFSLADIERFDVINVVKYILSVLLSILSYIFVIYPIYLFQELVRSGVRH